VNRNAYDLNDPKDRARFEGFGRPARGDFDLPTAAADEGAARPQMPEVRAIEGHSMLRPEPAAIGARP
jgi:hypothetical protein